MDRGKCPQCGDFRLGVESGKSKSKIACNDVFDCGWSLEIDHALFPGMQVAFTESGDFYCYLPDKDYPYPTNVTLVYDEPEEDLSPQLVPDGNRELHVEILYTQIGDFFEMVFTEDDEVVKTLIIEDSEEVLDTLETRMTKFFEKLRTK